jgi:hypothetical protein
MRTLTYPGFSNKACHCGFVLIPAGTLPGEKSGVVFVQRSLNQTSITNQIEVIASIALDSALRGQNPNTIRFFEYYPADLKPLVEWQEVTFSTTYGLYKNMGAFARLMRSIKHAEPDFYEVETPGWHPVSRQLQAQLVEWVDGASATA